jgi:formate hydrogenlyase subunit 3/multisubunit Na+/H+ antiporter MnhD subunit
MDAVSWMPFWILMSSVVPGVVIFFLSDHHKGLRTTLNMGGVTLKLILIGFMVAGLLNGRNYLFSFTLLPGMDLVLHADTMSVLIAALSGCSVVCHDGVCHRLSGRLSSAEKPLFRFLQPLRQCDHRHRTVR